MRQVANMPSMEVMRKVEVKGGSDAGGGSSDHSSTLVIVMNFNATGLLASYLQPLYTCNLAQRQSIQVSVPA